MDDDELIRLMVREILKTVGIEVALAADGLEAMRQYHAAKDAGRPVDVIIMDLVIPQGQGGLETIRQLREIDSETKVVISSGYHDASAVADFRSRGFNGKLAKPYSGTELKATILSLLNAEKVSAASQARPVRFATAV
jgi:CheY-like chemotaxis protein